MKKFVIVFLLLYGSFLADIVVFKVGVGYYKDNRIPNLQSAINDCGYFQNIIDFVFKDSHIKEINLYDKNANLINFREKIFYLLKESINKDTLIFYFSGHGYVKKFDSDLLQFIALYDSDLDNPATFFSKEEFILWFSKIKARLKIVILDNCFSFKIDPEEIDNNTVIISASSSVTKSFVFKNINLSYFTFYFGKAIKGRADFNNDNIVELGEIQKYLEQIFIIRNINLTPVVKYSSTFVFKRINSNIAFVLSKNRDKVMIDIGRDDNFSIKSKLIGSTSNISYSVDSIENEYSMLNVKEELVDKYFTILYNEKVCNLVIEAKPWAIIELDGDIYGYTPYIIKSIRIGKHKLKLSHPQLGQKTFDITISNEKTRKIKVDMNEKKVIIY